jgi:hypothetical protein
VSAEALTWAFRQGGHTHLGEIYIIKPATRFLLVTLADRCNHEGVAWPGYQDLAYRTGYTTRRVMQLMATLIKSGLVEKVERQGERGRQTSNLYVLHFERGVGFHEIGRRVDRVARYNATLPREPMVAQSDDDGAACGQVCAQPVDNSLEHAQEFHPPPKTYAEVKNGSN